MQRVREAVVCARVGVGKRREAGRMARVPRACGARVCVRGAAGLAVCSQRAVSMRDRPPGFLYSSNMHFVMKVVMRIFWWVLTDEVTY